MNTYGVVMIAHNNTEIDYAQMAYVNALLVKHNMKCPTALITDAGTVDWLKQNFSTEQIAYAFDHIVITETPDSKNNIKTYNDSSFTSKKLTYNNKNRVDAYDLSPFDETILLDTDFLILDDTLNKCWGSGYDFLINKDITTPSQNGAFVDDTRLTKLGIPQYWATVVYFRKSELARQIFDLVKHIKDNYTFYKFTYGFSGSIYRNDFAFSIAVHIMNGFSETSRMDLPIPTLMFVSDVDVLVDVPDVNKLVFLIEKEKERGNYIAMKCTRNVHVMNKYSINRFIPKFCELYTPENLKKVADANPPN